MELTKGLLALREDACAAIKDENIQEIYRKCFGSTWETTLSLDEDGTSFVITGDIEAMWLRDSSMQVLPYLEGIGEEEVWKALRGLVWKQAECVNIDPYANAFNKNGDYSCWLKDDTEMGPYIWERKYEVDSLAFHLFLLEHVYQAAKEKRPESAGELLTEAEEQALEKILEVWKTEQRHATSPYTFRRDSDLETETLQNDGRGRAVGYTGMTWSGFRPSDDACYYNYLIPSNILAVSVLKELKKLPVREDLAEKAAKLAGELEEGIDRYGIIRHPEYGEIFVYETDGLGNYRLMDDANLPSLLGTTLVPVKEKWKEVYRNTRRFLLSAENPYYYEGKFGKGIGSPHTPERYIWHIALCVQGMTSEDPEEQKEILETLKNTTAGTNLMHEGFDVDAPEHFTRDWFAWANSMFCLFVNSLLS